MVLKDGLHQFRFDCRPIKFNRGVYNNDNKDLEILRLTWSSPIATSAWKRALEIEIRAEQCLRRLSKLKS